MKSWRDVHPVAWIVLAAVAGLAWFAWSSSRDRRDVEQVGALQARIAAKDSAIAQRDSALAAHAEADRARDSLFLAALTVAMRTRVTAGGAIAASQAAPTDLPKAQAAVRACVLALAADSTALTACDVARRSKDSTIALQAQQLAAERQQRKTEQQLAALRIAGPRIRTWADAGLRARPMADAQPLAFVGKLGGDLRLVGRASLAAEAAWQPAVPKSATLDATVRIHF